MSDKTGIEWTNHTFNPWWGCSRVSPGCRFCYADRDAQRYGYQLWRRHGARRMLTKAWDQPAVWNRAAERAGVAAMVFCASMADVFEDHPDVAEPRKQLWDLIEATPWLRWQLLTKRPENVAGMVPWGSDWPSWVWLGVSAENQQWADTRIPLLLELPAKVRFVSAEPLLGPLDLAAYLIEEQRVTNPIEDAPDGAVIDGMERHGDWWDRIEHLHWLIAGGESGPRARPMHPDWATSLRDQCVNADVPFLFKQWGEWRPLADNECALIGDEWPAGTYGAMCRRVGKRAAGRELDGRTWDEFPRELVTA
jgi:protein gp37